MNRKLSTWNYYCFFLMFNTPITVIFGICQNNNNYRFLTDVVYSLRFIYFSVSEFLPVIFVKLIFEPEYSSQIYVRYEQKFWRKSVLTHLAWSSFFKASHLFIGFPEYSFPFTYNICEIMKITYFKTPRFFFFFFFFQRLLYFYQSSRTFFSFCLSVKLWE